MEDNLDDFFDNYQRQHPTMEASAEETMSDEMRTPPPPQVPLAKLRDQREQLDATGGAAPGPVIFNLNPNSKDYQQQRQLAERGIQFNQEGRTEAETRTFYADLKAMQNRPFTQADAMRLTELENGFATVERDLEAGLITPEVAQQAMHRLATPMGTLTARKQQDEEKRRQNELRRQDDLHARSTAVNDLANKARAMSIEERSKFVEVPAQYGGGAQHIFVGSDGKEHVTHIKPEKMEQQKPLEAGKVKREAEAGVQTAGIDKEDPKFASAVNTEAAAARALHDDPFVPDAPISDVEGDAALKEYGELYQKFPKARERPPAVAERMKQLTWRASTYATRRRAEGRPMEGKAAKPAAAVPGQPMQWGGVKSADEIGNKLKSIDAELAKRRAASEPQLPKFGPG